MNEDFYIRVDQFWNRWNDKTELNSTQSINGEIMKNARQTLHDEYEISVSYFQQYSNVSGV